MRLLLALTLALTIAKVANWMDVSWWLVLLPLYGPPLLLSAVLAAYLLLLITAALLEGVQLLILERRTK